jgi:hypothetical protein
VHPIHRVVPGLPPGELAQRAAAGMAVRRLDGGAADGLDAAVAALADAGRSGPAFLLASGDAQELHLLSEPDPGGSPRPCRRPLDAWAALDVSVLHALVVRRCGGLPDDVDTSATSTTSPTRSSPPPGPPAPPCCSTRPR